VSDMSLASPSRCAPSNRLDLHHESLGQETRKPVPNEKVALRRNLAERAIDGVFSDRGFSIDSAV
jgi:hypothetical protein